MNTPIKVCLEADFFYLFIFWGLRFFNKFKVPPEGLKKSINLSRAWNHEPWISKRVLYPEITAAYSVIIIIIIIIIIILIIIIIIIIINHRPIFLESRGSLTSLKSQTRNPRLKILPGWLVLRGFTSWKIHRPQPDLNPWTLDLEANTLLRNHRGLLYK